jgi:hypothetical protein
VLLRAEAIEICKRLRESMQRATSAMLAAAGMKDSAKVVKLEKMHERSGKMGAAERIAELMKAMHEREIGEVLDFAEFLIAKREREQKDAFAVF